MYTNDIISLVEEDINQWIKDFIEESNEFYNNQFPVCPYARSARMKNESIVKVYDGSGVYGFINKTVDWLIADEQYQVSLMVFPSRVKYYLGIHRYIRHLNSKTISNDFFSLCGSAPHTKCQFPGVLNQGEYFVIGTNRLSKVLPAVEKLKKKGYYDNWSDDHYNAIVKTREEMYEKYKDT